MPMDAKVYAVLSEGLKDKKITVGDKELAALDVVSGWLDTADGIEKLRTANTEISTERETLKKQLKETKKEVDDAKAEVDRYRKNALTDEDRKKFDEYKKTGMTSETEARFNALQAKLEEALNKHSELTKSLAEKDAATAKATREKLDSDMRSDLVTKLAEKKISGKNAKLAIAAIMSDGLAKLNEKGERVYTIQKDGKALAASIDELVADFASQNENLIDASGNRGTGADPGISTNRAGAGVQQGVSLDALRSQAADMLMPPGK